LLERLQPWLRPFQAFVEIPDLVISGVGAQPASAMNKDLRNTTAGRCP
jgi:hypothetical protein